MRWVLIVAVALLVGGAAIALVGRVGWSRGTAALRTALEQARTVPTVRVYHERDELAALPPPVQRYLRTALTDGQPMIAAVTLTHTGTFNLREEGEQWVPFHSDQRVTLHRPGFDWDARVSMMPGVVVHVHDAYVAGNGQLEARILGLLRVADLRGTPESAEGEFYRWIAEAPWYPTALLPSQGARWDAIDDHAARVTITDGAVRATMTYTFGDDGLPHTVRAESRGRLVGGRMIPTPWEGRWRGWKQRDGMRVPTEGEVAWVLPTGDKPYWRGRIASLRHEFVPP